MIPGTAGRDAPPGADAARIPDGAAPPASAPGARLFFALWPSDEVRRALAHVRDHHVNWSPEARRVATGKLHLTLHFLGRVERERAQRLRDSAFFPRCAPFDLSFGCFEIWPAGIAAWQPQETPAELMRLHESLGAALAALGFAVEQRRFRPHVTLARRASGSSVAAPLPPLRWRAQGFALVESRLGAGGGYRVLRRYP